MYIFKRATLIRKYGKLNSKYKHQRNVRLFRAEFSGNLMQNVLLYLYVYQVHG